VSPARVRILQVVVAGMWGAVMVLSLTAWLLAVAL
jgi:hypothetical protein